MCRPGAVHLRFSPSLAVPPRVHWYTAASRGAFPRVRSPYHRPPSFPAECPVAKPNYSFAKRQRELAKSKKKEEKNQRKLAKSSASGDVPVQPPIDPSAAAHTSDTAGST